jgi:glycosyltransferase involved in cell wall biosynthesis
MNHFDSNLIKPVVYFGRITESKGIKLIIRSIYELYQQGFPEISPLWIIGGNNPEIKKQREQEEIKNMVLELENNRLLFWWGHVPHETLPFILRKCALFCFASEYEPGGRTILEAMACRLPVIATPQGFAPEIIKEGVNGFIIEEKIPQLWAEKIKILLSDNDLAYKMGEQAQLTVKDYYTIDHFFQRHWEIYQGFQPKI